MIRRRFVLSFLAALFAVGVAGESGAVPNESRIWIAGTTLKVRDASTGSYYNDFDNGVIVKVKRDEGAAYASDVAGTLIPGPGCVAFSGEDTSAGRSEDLYHPDEGGWTVRCPFTTLKKVDINVGAGNDLVWLVLSHVPAKIVGGANADEIEVFSCTPPPYFAKTNINGGLGDDYIVGGQGDDTLVGQRGYDYIEGTCGEDRISAGSDDDFIYADDTNWCDTDCPPTTDRVNCGDGEDGVGTDGVDITFNNCESVD